MLNSKSAFSFITILSLFVFNSCNPDDIEFISAHGFPDIPVNLSIFNSKYDDYNSDVPPGQYDMWPLIFSSNSTSKDKDFDFKMFTMEMSYPFDEDLVTIRESAGTSSTQVYLSEIIDDVNTTDNQFGPLVYYLPESMDPHKEEFIFFYAEGIEDLLNLKYWTHLLVEEPTIHNRYQWSGPFSVKSINTMDHCEAYITIQAGEVYYCSNRKGNYEICKKKIPAEYELIEFLHTDNENIDDVAEILNSDADDKCPYFEENFMVFASNRIGGYGGYDLWYSVRENGYWGVPENFGSQINSEYDEYRPVFRKYDKIENDLMVFSSNRPGGQGGFDLYYVGIDTSK